MKISAISSPHGYCKKKLRVKKKFGAFYKAEIIILLRTLPHSHDIMLHVHDNSLIILGEKKIA